MADGSRNSMIRGYTQIKKYEVESFYMRDVYRQRAVGLKKEAKHGKLELVVYRRTVLAFGD
jgi:hypothetical protein